MRRSALASCSLLIAAACASAGPEGPSPAADSGVGPADGAEPDAPPDPRRGWIDLGSPPSAAAGDVSSPRLAIWNGKPVIAYSADRYVRVYRYDQDSTWTAVGAPLRHSSETNAVTYDPTPVVGADGLAVVWPEWSAGSMSNPVRRMANGSWSPPPGAAVLGTPGAYSFVPHSSATVGGDGAMWIAYAETTDLNAPMRISVVSLLGADVFQRGSAISATGTNSGALAPDLAIHGADQFMTWTENGVRLAKRNVATGAWEPFGNSPITVAGRPATTQANGRVTVDSAGRPIIAFTSSNGTENGIYVARWTGSSWSYWHEMLQATPGQVAGMTTHPYLFDIVAAGADLAYVAWYEADASSYEGIYIYRCAPGGCTAVGRGRLDATPGATRGYGPRLVVDGANRPLVTWVEDDAAGNAQAHVWRYHGDPDTP